MTPFEERLEIAFASACWDFEKAVKDDDILKSLHDIYCDNLQARVIELVFEEMVERWHESDTEMTIHDFMGISLEDYGRIVLDNASQETKKEGH